MRYDRQTYIDMAKLKFVLRNSTNAPKNGSVIGCEMLAYKVTDYVIHGRGSHYHRSDGNWHSVTKDLRFFGSLTNTQSGLLLGVKMLFSEPSKQLA